MSADIYWLRKPTCAWVRQRQYTGKTKPHRYTLHHHEVVGLYGVPGNWTVLYLAATLDDGAGPWTDDKYIGEMVKLEQPSKIDSYERGERRAVANYWKEYDEHWASQPTVAAIEALDKPSWAARAAGRIRKWFHL